jgi:hypothetical protein
VDSRQGCGNEERRPAVAQCDLKRERGDPWRTCIGYKHCRSDIERRMRMHVVGELIKNHISHSTVS